MFQSQMKLEKHSFDPHCRSSAKWNYLVFIACTCTLFLDMFFLYIPTAGSPGSLHMDRQLGARITFARSVADFIVLLDMILKFHQTTHTHLKFDPFDRHRLVNMPRYLALNYKSSLVVDLLAIIPLPQVVVGYKHLGKESLFYSIAPQFPIRMMAMSPYSERNAKIMSILKHNAWSGALLNLFFFITISNGAGGIYYDMYTSKLSHCRYLVYKEVTTVSNFTWDELITQCTEKHKMEFGLFADAVTNKLATRSFIQKYTYCLSWGLKSLSSFGQIINANSDISETILSFVAVVFGLILFGDLLARMQTGLQCTEQKEDRQRARHRIVDEWMKYHQFPQNLKKDVKQTIQSEWSATHGTNDQTILDSLPWDIRSEIRRHLYMEIVSTMHMFREMDDDLTRAICGYLGTFSVKKGAYVAFEGEPVHQMMFVFSGELEASSANNRQRMILGPGDMCGKELLEWCSHPTKSTESLQPSAQTVKCLTDVDAFCLRADDVKILAIQFHRDGKFRRAFQRYAA